MIAWPLSLYSVLSSLSSISLSDFTKWLAQQAEELEVEIYPGFSASEVLYDENNKVVGIATCDMGCLLYTSPSPRDRQKSRMPSSA